jgi:microcystin degradation protein MlrC
VLAASVFTGFPHADIRNAGLSAVVCTDANAEQARQMRDALLDQAWENRSAFLYEGQPLAESVARAKSSTTWPVVLLDHCDNSASGGTMDTTGVLAEVLRQDLRDAVFYAIRDPQAVERAIAAGVGNELTLSLGGLSELKATGDVNAPITVSARVRIISDGAFRLRGPMMAGVAISAGKTVVLQVGGVQVVVTSLATEPHDLAYLMSLGIDLDRTRYLVLKSRVHWRAGFGSLAQEVIECDSVGVTTSDYSKLRFERVRRPIYPLDEL